jgi:hypothetical protein
MWVIEVSRKMMDPDVRRNITKSTYDPQTIVAIGYMIGMRTR